MQITYQIKKGAKEVKLINCYNVRECRARFEAMRNEHKEQIAINRPDRFVLFTGESYGTR